MSLCESVERLHARELVERAVQHRISVNGERKGFSKLVKAYEAVGYPGQTSAGTEDEFLRDFGKGI